MASDDHKLVKRAVREFITTSALLGSALLLAIISTFFVQSDEFQFAVIAAIGSLVLAGWGGIYIVPKLSRRINLHLFSWKFPYSATPETAFFAVITIIVGFSAINTGNNQLYLIFSIMIA